MAWLLERLGEAAALGAATCWAISSIAFTAAGRRIGPTLVNLARMILAVLVFIVVHRLIFGVWIPEAAAPAFIILAISGIIGLAVGDQFLFASFVDVGPRLSTLLMTLAPPVTALLAWPVLDEPLTWLAILGIAVTMAGIAWVAIERPQGRHAPPIDDNGRRVRGLIFGALAGICQAVALVLAKLGMGHALPGEAERLDPWSVTMIRMVFGAIGIAVMTPIIHRTVTRRAQRKHKAEESTSGRDPSRASSPPPRLPLRRFVADRSVAGSTLFMLLLGTAAGPVIGVWLSMTAIDRTEAGIAATLMAMTPVVILPLAIFIERERVSSRAAIGAVIAVLGVAILMNTNA